MTLSRFIRTSPEPLTQMSLMRVRGARLQAGRVDLRSAFPRGQPSMQRDGLRPRFEVAEDVCLELRTTSLGEVGRSKVRRAVSIAGGRWNRQLARKEPSR